jgi:hypothetical protein
MPHPQPIPLLIVGGGIGGLASALAVADTGRPVHLLEQAPAFAEVGAGIQLAPNATAVLDCLGVLAPLSERAVFPNRLVLMDAVAGEPITALDVGAGFRERYGHPYLGISPPEPSTLKCAEGRFSSQKPIGNCNRLALIGRPVSGRTRRLNQPTPCAHDRETRIWRERGPCPLRADQRPQLHGLQESRRLPIGLAPSAAGTRCAPGEFRAWRALAAGDVLSSQRGTQPARLLLVQPVGVVTDCRVTRTQPIRFGSRLGAGRRRTVVRRR